MKNETAIIEFFLSNPQLFEVEKNEIKRPVYITIDDSDFEFEQKALNYISENILEEKMAASYCWSCSRLFREELKSNVCSEYKKCCKENFDNNGFECYTCFGDAWDDSIVSDDFIFCEKCGVMLYSGGYSDSILEEIDYLSIEDENLYEKVAELAKVKPNNKEIQEKLYHKMIEILPNITELFKKNAKL